MYNTNQPERFLMLPCMIIDLEFSVDVQRAIYIYYTVVSCLSPGVGGGG